MLVQKDFLSQLRWLGLNSYESRLWTALLAKGTASAGELSDLANVPRSRTYDVLEGLERKGFIIMKLGKPIKYIALPPEAVLDRVKKKISEDADHKTKQLNSLKDTEMLNELKLLHKTGIDMVEPFELSGCLKGRKNIYSHLESLMKGATKNITIMTSEDGILRKKDAFHKILKKAKEKGVKIRIAAPMERLAPESKKQALELKDAAEIKSIAMKSRFCVIDSKHLVFMLSDDRDVNPGFDSAIWVTTPFLAAAFEKMFDSAK